MSTHTPTAPAAADHTAAALAELSRLPQDARVIVQGGLALKDIALFGSGQVQIEFEEQIIDSSPTWIVFVKQ